MRRIDWKTSAAVGRLQVRRCQPAIAVEALISLNLNLAEYSSKARFATAEFAIVVAASIASRLIEQRQSVGLATNGDDPLADSLFFQRLPPRKGQGQLMSCLDLLARVNPTGEAEAMPFAMLLRQACVGLSWGSTLIVVAAAKDQDLMPALIHLRRQGFLAMLVIVDSGIDFYRIRAQAGQIGVPAYRVFSERDLDVWR